MKKIFAIVLTLALLFSLAGCSSGSGGDQPAQTADPQQSAEQPAESTEKPEEVSYTIDNEVIVDNEYCSLTVVSGEAKKSGAPEFKLLLENKTTDKTLMFSIDNVSVNGWEIEPFFATSVAAGKKANDTLSIPKDQFQECGLTYADKIQFDLRVYDNDDWLADEFVEDTFVIYPTGRTEDEIVIPARRTTPNEVVIEDNDQFAFVLLDVDEGNFWGYTVNAYVENKTDHTVMFSWDDVSVNGFMIDPFWATSVAPGSRTVSGISFSESDFEENNIDSVDEIEFELRVYYYDDWLSSDIFKDTFTYSPQ